ncbi:hypothetical protein ACLM5H_00005 [Fredinandcohnia humi]
MQLIKFELYKIFSQKIIYITFILLVLFSTGLTFERTEEWKKDIYREWEGTLTAEKVKHAELQYKELEMKTAEMEMGETYSEEEFTKMGVYETIAMLNNVKMNVKQKLTELESEDNYNTELEKSMLKQVDVSYFAYNKGPEKIIDYTSIFAILVSGAMLLIGLSSIYSQEYSTGVDNFQLSSKKGRNSLMWAKISAALIYTLVVIIAWEIFNIGMNIVQYGNEGWETSIQSYFKYYFSPYDFTLIEFHLLQLGIHTLAACSFAITIVLISSVCKHSLISFIISGIIFAVPYLIVEILQPPVWREIFHFTFVYVMNVEPFFDRFQTVNLFGTPILSPFIAVVVMVVLAIVAVSLTLRVVKNREVTS